MERPSEQAFYDGLMEPRAAKPAPPAPVSSQPKLLTSKSLFSHPDAHPLILDLSLIKHLGMDWFGWLPETLFAEIERELKTSIAEVNKLKILAAQTLHMTDAYWDQWEIFEKTIQALNGIPPRLDVMQPPDLPFLYAGVDIANLIRSETYAEEVGRYCAAIFLYENVHYAPDPLDFCQVYITQPTYCCLDCDKCGPAMPPFDGLCTSCAGHFDDDKPLNFKADPAKLERGFGRNITRGVTFDPEPTRKRFEELDKMPPGDVQGAIRETVEDIQAAKLIHAIDFKNYRTQQLRDQRAALRGWLETE